MTTVDVGDLVMGPEEVFTHYLVRVIGLQIRMKQRIANESSDHLLSNCFINGSFAYKITRRCVYTFFLDNPRRIRLSQLCWVARC